MGRGRRGEGEGAYSTDRVLQASGVVLNVHSCEGIIYIGPFYFTNLHMSSDTIVMERFRDLSQATLSPSRHLLESLK